MTLNERRQELIDKYRAEHDAAVAAVDAQMEAEYAAVRERYLAMRRLIGNLFCERLAATCHGVNDYKFADNEVAR